jgi:pimeloyl-ACP methyl ester carboxylesterase
MRGRGLSGDHRDLTFSRRVDDVLAYVDGIGEATGLVGWSAGAYLALGAAQCDAVDAVALFEPVMPSVIGPQERAALGATLARMGELAAEDRLTDAVRAFAGFVFNDAEVAELEDAGYVEAAGRYTENILNVHRQASEYQGPTPDNAAVLGAISAPVLVLHGSDTKPFFAAGARHVANHVPSARIQKIASAGHAAPLTHPEALAEALTEFFSSAP